MTTTETAPAGTDTEAAPTLPELIARQLSSTQVVDGQVLRFEAGVDDDGRYIALDITRVEFAADADTTMRVLLHLSDPIAPAADESGVEIGASA